MPRLVTDEPAAEIKYAEDTRRRLAAKAAGETTYIPVKLCKNLHQKRLVSNADCIECRVIRNIARNTARNAARAARRLRQMNRA